MRVAHTLARIEKSPAVAEQGPPPVAAPEHLEAPVRAAAAWRADVRDLFGVMDALFGEGHADKRARSAAARTEHGWPWR